MTLSTFHEWRSKSENMFFKTASSDELGNLIRQAGPAGVRRRDLLNTLEIDSKLLNQILDSLRGLGEISFHDDGDGIVVRSTEKLGGVVG